MTRIFKTCLGSAVMLGVLALGACGPMETSRTTTTERTTERNFGIPGPPQTSTTTTTSIRQTTP